MKIIVTKRKIRLLKTVGLLYILVLPLMICSCEDFLEIDPPQNETTNEEVFAENESIKGAVNGMYSAFLGFLTMFDGGLEVYTGVLSDEFTNQGTFDAFLQFNANEIQPDEPEVFDVFWRNPYNIIFRANSVLENLEDNTSLPPEPKDQFIGEALFVRALVHFYLVNLFGDIPFISSTDVNSNTVASREPVSEVYLKIQEDLLRAKALLSEDFSFVESRESIRPSKAAADLLLARTYLYTQDWANAVALATEVINNPLFQLEPNLDDVFLASSREAIWQTVPLRGLRNGETRIGASLVIDVFPPGFPVSIYPQVILSDSVVNSFSSEDARRSQWIGLGFGIFNFSNKYKNSLSAVNTDQEYTAIMRLAEAFLIRAEANAQLGNLSTAIADLDVIRARAQVELIRDSNPGISQRDLIETIYQEKVFEFFAEGHRWFDLKRTGRADEVLGPIKENWEATDVLLPIPEQEIFANSNLTQNPGY